MTEDAVVEQRSAGEAFALLGDPLRVDVLRALAETPDEPVGFAELRRRVDERDSGKFNYHLGKLTGSFVRRLDGDDHGPDGDGAGGGSAAADAPTGYELTMAGRQVVGALLAGTYTADVSMPAVQVDAECPRCDATLEALYEDEQAVVRCPDCDGFLNRHDFPPGTVAQFAPAELPAAFDRWLRTSFGRITAGFCTTCAGRVDGRLLVVGEDRDPGAADLSYEVAYARYTCGRCGSDSRSSVFIPLLFHPAGVAFFHDHGLDVTTIPSWELAHAAEDSDVALVAEDPPSVRLTVPLDDEALIATLDETVTVVDVERRAL